MIDNIEELYRCPKCEGGKLLGFHVDGDYEGSASIQINGRGEVIDAENTWYGEYTYKDTSEMVCNECSHRGIMTDFEIPTYWTQEEIDKAKKEGKRLAELFSTEE